MKTINKNLQSENTKRGAVSYGLPFVPKLADFIEDVSPTAKQQRNVSMFFAGQPIPAIAEKLFSVILEQLDEEEN